MGNREGYRWSRGGWQPSPSQRRILDGVAAGEGNAALARRLGLSTETVRWHVRQLIAETDSIDRAGLARWWNDRQRAVSFALAA
jgi:DNA-binding CsgD family transcriptional regulator